MYRSTFWVLLFMVAIALPQANALPHQAASATTAAVSPEDVKLLLQRLHDLEDQVAALKTQVNKIADNSSKPSESAVNAPPVSEPATEQGMYMAGHTGETISAPRLQLRGYGDVGWNTSDLKGSKNSFVLGQFNLFITSRLTDKVSFLS